MGREIKRVPLDFDFPLEKSYGDHMWEIHRKTCKRSADDCADECDFSDDPPSGPGWQLWQTISDGPITPVFSTPEALVDHMTSGTGSKWATGWDRGGAEAMVKCGWIPSRMSINGVMLSDTDIAKDFAKLQKSGV